jgi:hypothetical protein
MKTQKPKNLNISFPSSNSNIIEHKLIHTPKLSFNNSEHSLFKETNKINELKLPSINCIFSSSNSTNQNSNSNFESSSLKLKKQNFKNSLLKKLPHNEVKLKKIFGNRFKNFSKQNEKINENRSLKISESTSTILLKNFKKYKLKKDLNFHRNLMSLNIEKLNSSNQNEQKETEDEYIKNIGEDPSKKPPKTGIFGPRNNIINIIRAEMERLKYDNIYKGVELEIKELIKDEIMDAQVKLKRKPENLVFNKKLERPLYLKKIDKYKYISSMNKTRELNQIANVSVVEEDGNIMKRLANDAYDALIHERGKNS